MAIAIFNRFDRHNLRGDLYGGLTAAVVALPLGLAFGVASGAGAISGVYSAILVGFFASLFGGTPAQISGPTGPMTVVMTGILTQYMARDPENGLASAFTIVVLAGLLQILFGALKLGKYIVQVSYPVISGFMSGIGVIIILLQLGPFFGGTTVDTPLAAMMDIPAMLQSIHLPTTVLSVAMLALLFGWPSRFNEYIPSPVLVLVVGTLACVLLSELDAVAVIGLIPHGIPEFHFPRLDFALVIDELGFAIILATLGSIDSLLTSLVTDNITQSEHNSDKELVGQGIGNIIAGCFFALPGAGATVRTVVNVKAGGHSAYAGLIHALILLFIVLIAAGAAERIPLAVLAAILIKVGVDIVDRRFLRKLHRIPLFSSGLMLTVLVLTVFVDLITAVFVGVFIANMVTVDRLTDIQLDNIGLSLLDSDADTDDGQRTALLEINGPMSFGVARGINRRLAELKGHQRLVIDLSNAVFVGVTSSLTILDIIEDELRNDRVVFLIGVRQSIVNTQFERLGIFDLLGPNQILESLEELPNSDSL